MTITILRATQLLRTAIKTGDYSEISRLRDSLLKAMENIPIIQMYPIVETVLNDAHEFLLTIDN